MSWQEGTYLGVPSSQDWGTPWPGLGYPPGQDWMGYPLERTWDQWPGREPGTGVPPGGGKTENITFPILRMRAVINAWNKGVFTARVRSTREGNVLTRVCPSINLSVHRGGYPYPIMLCNISQNAMRQWGGTRTPPGGVPGSGTPGGVPGSGTPPGGGYPGRTTEGVLTTRRAVCLLRSRRRTFLLRVNRPSNYHDNIFVQCCSCKASKRKTTLTCFLASLACTEM